LRSNKPQAVAVPVELTHNTPPGEKSMLISIQHNPKDDQKEGVDEADDELGDLTTNNTALNE